MALQKPSPGLLPAENYSRFGLAFNTIDLLAAQLPFAQQAIEALLGASASHGTALTTLQQQGLSASQAIAALLAANSGYAQALTELQANDGALDVLIGSLENLTDAHGKAITAEQSRAATAEALARIIAAPKYSVPLDTITLPNGGAVYWTGSTSTGAGETSGGLRVPQGQTGIFSQHRTRFQPTAAQRTKFAGRPVQFMVAFRSTVGALTALRDSAGFSTLGGVIEGVPSIVGVKIYSIRPDLWLAVGDAVLTGNESVITIALQVSGNTIPVAADVSFVAIGALFMPVDATGTTDVLADLMQPLALRADNLIAAARVRYAPLLGAAPGVTDRVLGIPAGQSGAGSLAIYGAPVAGLQAGTRVRCRFAIQVAGGAFVLNGVSQSDPPVTLIQLFGATVEMTDGSQVGAVAGLTATSPTTYEASVTFTATGAERIAEFYLKVDENSAVRLTEGQIRVGQMFVDVLSTEPTTTVAAQTARLTESFRAFIAAAPDRFRDWCSASSLSDGDYGTIREAVAAMRTGGSQDQPNRVVVLPGTYTNECATGVSINPADYVEIVGKGARRDVEIIARLPDNQAAQDSQQPILLTRSGRLSGLTVRGRNVKYPGHLEAGNAPVAAIWDIDDCEFVHEGATGWTETSALGVGQNDGSKLTATGSTFLSPTSGVGIHNNVGWARGARADFTGCTLIGTGDSATSLAITSQGAGVMSPATLRGCVLSGRIHHYVSFLPGAPLSAYRGAPWEYTVRITDSDPVDWLSPCPFDVLTLTSVAAGNSAAAVGNTGAPRLFGRRPDVRPGAADYAARLHSSHLVSVPDGQFDPGVGLGARLGDMRGAAARPLDIFWDGSATAVTITLDQNYAGMTNAQVVAALNAKLSAAMGGNTGGRAFSLSQPYHNRAPIRQPDREATAVNAGTATIVKGHVLAKVGRRVRLMTSTDAASAFAGIALDDAVPGRSVRFLKTGLIGQAHLLFDGDQAFTAGARYQISASSPGRLVLGMDLPVLAVRSVETYGAALEIIGTVAFTGSATEAVRDAFAGITYRDVPGLPAVIETVVPKGAVGSEPVTLGGVTDTVANRLSALQAGQSSGSVAYDTFAQLNSNLTPADGATGQVTADGLNNGFYAKSGASGGGSWVRKSTATVPALDAWITDLVTRTVQAALAGGYHPDWVFALRNASKRLQAGLRRSDLTWMAPRLRAERDLEVGSTTVASGEHAEWIHAKRGISGRLQYGLHRSLTFFVVGLGFGRGERIQSLVKDWSWAVVGANLRPFLGVKNGDAYLGRAGSSTAIYMDRRDAQNRAHSDNLRVASGIRIQRPTTDYCLFLANGQSIAANQEGTPRLTKTPRADCKQIGDSIRPNRMYEPYYAPIGATQLKPLVATVETFNANVDSVIVDDATVAAWNPRQTMVLGEHSLVSATQGFAAAWEAEGRAPRTWVAVSPATPGRTIEQLLPGADPNLFQRNIDALNLFTGLVPAGKTASVVGTMFDQGQSNYGQLYGGSPDRATNKANYAAWRDAFNAAVAASTGQTLPPAMFMWQTGAIWTIDDRNLDVGMAQWEFSRETPGVYLVGNTNIFTDFGGHLNANGYRNAGNVLAKIMHRVLVRGEAWEPFSPLWIERIGRTLYIGCHVPAPPIQFMDTLFGTDRKMYPHKGFRVTDAAGEVPFGNIRIASPTIIAIDVSRDIDDSTLLWHGDKTTNQGNTNVYDSDSFCSFNDYVYDPTSGMVPADNIVGLVNKPLPNRNGLISFCLPAKGWSRI